ncbi:MAG: HlyD family efflux transporter periplasmic adaptor subunit [Archangiaceae bacterium]|nr:HlyD family efflux transporter periplasmic adaptor subunit [Archangiaceae bacterium]
MDVPRAKARKPARKVLLGGGALAALALVSLLLSRLGAAAPSVKRDGLWLGTVERSPLTREVRGPGTLVPEQIRFISASWPSRVELIRVKAGQTVAADTVLLELANPDLELQALEAERQLASAQAALVELGTQGQSSQLQLDAALATLQTDADDATRVAQANHALATRGLISEQEQQKTFGKSAELARRLALEKTRRGVLQQGLAKQLAAQREQLERLRAVAGFRRRQVEDLKVRAGESGVVQELVLQPGQWVAAGALLAKVARPERLKAELRISEVQARDVAVGQPARVDTRQGIVEGHVVRVDPSVVAGSVTVEVSLDGALPKGARPDLSVDGTIELERLPSVLHVPRPAFAAAEGPAQLFRLDADGAHATRVTVQLGRASTARVEVVSGLNEGDQVILSELSQLDSNERLDLK